MVGETGFLVLRRQMFNLSGEVVLRKSDVVDTGMVGELMAHVVVGLDAGADDYLVKPFNLTVLLARLRAHLRRRPDAATDAEPIRVGDLVVDVAARRCLLRDREIALRPKEFDLLLALARHPGVAVTREDLMAQVWDENWFGSTKTLDVTMVALRRRLSQALPPPTTPSGHAPPKITTLRGHGYRLELPPTA